MNKVARRTSRKAARDTTTAAFAAVLTTAIAAEWELIPEWLPVIALGAQVLLAAAYRWARDHGWLMPEDTPE